jgi:biopolymer transport protein ExbB
VTTWLGLTTAVPLLLLHSFANGAAKAVQQVLEEQSAGLIARQAESGKA